MVTALLAFLRSARAWAVWALLALVAALPTFFRVSKARGERQGRELERNEIERRAAEARIKHTRNAEDIEDEVADMGKPERRSRLGDMFQSDD